MMDDKKIEDAAKQHSEESYISDYFQACYKDAFMECAKWVQEEFLKDLWHPVSEEPKKGRVFLYKTIFKGYGLNKIIDGNEWKYIIKYKKLLNGFILMIYFQRKEINMSGLLSIIGMQTELDYLIGDFPACFGDTPLAIPKGNIPSDKQKCQPKEQHEFTIKGIKIMAASKKDAIKKYNHHKK